MTKKEQELLVRMARLTARMARWSDLVTPAGLDKLNEDIEIVAKEAGLTSMLTPPRQTKQSKKAGER